MSPIKTAGQLREFLLSTLDGIQNGKVDLTVASHIAKLSGRINESLVAEVRVAEMLRASGKPNAEFGQLQISTPSQ